MSSELQGLSALAITDTGDHDNTKAVHEEQSDAAGALEVSGGQVLLLSPRTIVCGISARRLPFGSDMLGQMPLCTVNDACGNVLRLFCP